MKVDVLAHMLRRIEELERRHANQERHGKITDVDHDKGMVKVTDGVWSSGWLRWHEHNSNGGIKTRTMPTKGSAATVRAMSGLLEQGTVTHGVYPTDTNKMPDAKDGEHVWQMGDDSDGNGKNQVKHVTDAKGNHTTTATNKVVKTVGDYSHEMTKDGGHIFKAGDKFTYKLTKDGGHELTSGDHSIKFTDAGVHIDAPTAFGQNYGIGSAPGIIEKLDNATAGNGQKTWGI